jgi:hypothetical protein
VNFARILLGALCLQDGAKLDDIRWIESKEAFVKAQAKETSRWVLIYKEWPR